MSVFLQQKAKLMDVLKKRGVTGTYSTAKVTQSCSFFVLFRLLKLLIMNVSDRITSRELD